MELSKNKLKYFASFGKKKVRDEEQKFVVEGNKSVEELLQSSFRVEAIVATREWLDTHTISCESYEATHEEIEKISLLQHPQDVWALAYCKDNDTPTTLQGLVLALDGVQDRETWEQLFVWQIGLAFLR